MHFNKDKFQIYTKRVNKLQQIKKSKFLKTL
jgi:hypothetical protein